MATGYRFPENPGRIPTVAGPQSSMFKNLTFNVIDVETANYHPSTICQIGLVEVRQGRVSCSHSILIDPETSFTSRNIQIHGIRPEHVRGAPTFCDIYAELYDLLVDQVLASHTPFDRIALEGAARRYGLPILPVRWLDSAAIARQAWPERYRQRGYRLAKVAGDLGITFRHHDAREDAWAAAAIVLHACLQTGRDIDDWLETAGHVRATK